MSAAVRFVAVLAVVALAIILASIVLTSPRQTVVTRWDRGPDGVVTTQTVTTYQLSTK